MPGESSGGGGGGGARRVVTGELNWGLEQT